MSSVIVNAPLGVKTLTGVLLTELGEHEYGNPNILERKQTKRGNE